MKRDLAPFVLVLLVALFAFLFSSPLPSGWPSWVPHRSPVVCAWSPPIGVVNPPTPDWTGCDVHP